MPAGSVPASRANRTSWRAIFRARAQRLSAARIGTISAHLLRARGISLMSDTSDRWL